MNVDVVLGMVGGLGLFLYGMKLMSDGLEKAAGARLRGILESLTRNRFIGMLVGILFTAVVQSSSATTVLVVSFVNASLMNLYQAAGVIMGANIGTTVTGQLIALNLTKIAPFILICGVVLVMFIKKPFTKRIGEVVLGFGMLFMGLSTMSGAMEVLKDSPQIVRIISSLDNPFLGVLTGFLVTAVLQSSSATVGILILMASQGMLPLHMCFYLILGCNMGSCVSALLASLGAKKDAQRAAFIHFLFNLIGSGVIIMVLAFLSPLVEQIITSFTGGMENQFVNGINSKLARDVANTHTIFKVFQVLVLFPFSNWIVKLTYLIIPGEEERVDEKQLMYIGAHTVFSPATAVPQAILEIERMGEIAIGNLNRSMRALLTKDKGLLQQIYDTEETIDYMNTEITNYLVKANQQSLPVDDRKAIAGLFHVVNDMERIGDHAENVGDAALVMIEEGLSFSEEGQLEVREMLLKVNQLLDYSLEMFSKKTEAHLKEILDLENQVDKLERELQHNHVVRLTEHKCECHAGMIFTDLCSNLERVADHGTNIAFSILESDPEGNKRSQELTA